MRKGYIAVSAVFLALVIAFSPHLYSRLLWPKPPQVEKAFSGVLKLWVVDGYHSNALPWVSVNTAAYERKNNGVFIHSTRMDAEMLSTRLGRGERPDIIVFPTGTIAAPRELLLPVAMPEAVKDEYARSAMSGDEHYALPVIAGGYALLVNTDRVSEGSLPPEDWGGLVDSLFEGNKQIKKRRYGITCAGPSQRSAPLALISLLGPDWTRGTALKRDSVLSAQFAKGDWDTALSSFVTGQSAMLVATQREVRRLETLDTGALNYDVFVPDGGTFTDQVTYVGIVKQSGASEERISACERFAELLISETAQAGLSKYGVFPVTDGLTLYDDETEPMLARIERALAGDLKVPNTFAWTEAREDFAQRCERFLMGESDNNPLLFLP